LGGADGAAHLRVRRIVGQSFTAGRNKALTDDVRARANELAQHFVDQGGGDWVSDFAVPLTAGTIAVMLGVEEARQADLARWSAAFVRIGNPSLSAGELEVESALMGNAACSWLTTL
jgi:cytochrome P450